MVDSDILARALEKVRNILHGDTRAPDFSARELIELRDCILPRLGDSTLPECDRLACEQVLAVVRDHWAAAGLEDAPPGAGGRDAGQHGFRATLDKFLEGRFAEVTRDDLRTLRAAGNRLAAAVSARTPSHDRLQRMITGCLERYRVYLAGTLPDSGLDDSGVSVTLAGDESSELGVGLLPGVPALSGEQPREDEGAASHAQVALNVPAAGTRHRAEDLFAPLRRTDVECLGGIPVNLRIRECEADGDLVIEGDIPEDVFVRVKGGGLLVEGFVSGHVYADGGIRVSGNVNAGWLISEEGDIAVERVLMGARIVARKGTVECKGIEGAELIVAGGAIRVEGDVRGGLLAARDLDATGVLHAAHVRCTGLVSVRAAEASGQGGVQITLQRFLPLYMLGTEMTPELVKAFRGLHEANLRAAVLRAFRTGLSTDRLHLMRAILFETRAALMTGFTLADLRDAQLRHAFLPMVLALGQELYSGVLEAYEMQEEHAGRAVGALADMVPGLAGWLERELAAYPPGMLKQGRMLAEQCLRHVVSAARKLREGGPREGAGADTLEAMAERLDEFAELAAAAAREVDELLSHCARETLLHLADNLDALRAKTEEAARADAGSRRQVRELQELNRQIGHIDDEICTLDKQVKECAALRDMYREEIAAAAAAVFPDTWPGAARVCAKHYSAGVRISVSPLENRVRKVPMGACLNLADALNGEGVLFERAGHTVRKVLKADDIRQ